MSQITAVEQTSSAPVERGSGGDPDDRNAYDRVFWLGYLANGLVTVCNATMVRYADFVSVLGGEEQQLGLIVGCGMVGSILMRFAQGVAIDRYGAGRVWVVSMMAYSISLVAHLGLTSAFSPTTFLVRMLMQSSLAGVFGASLTFVSLRVSPRRTAEIIGTIGTSGFVGMMVGPVIADWVCGHGKPGMPELQRLFGVAIAVSLIGTVTAWLGTRREVPAKKRRQPRLTRVIGRYTPWVTALVAAAMGAGFAIPFTFLRPFSVEKRIDHIWVYFTVYSVTALIARLATRQLFHRFGNRPWIVAGMMLLTTSYALYLPAANMWQLALPGAVAGVAHALLFPSVMAAGTSAFPRRFMGIATSLMLAMFDFGNLVGSPVVGKFLQVAKGRGWDAYDWMFGGTAVTMAAITVLFWRTSADATTSDKSSR